jgi:endonuclease/exonuclease/phosphatase family metal-dependent hydrolase
LISDDALSNKGVVCVKIEKDGKILHVLTTHLQASYTTVSGGEARKEQIVGIAKIIKEIQSQDKDKVAKIILTGDMNFAQKTLEKSDKVDEFMDQMEILEKTGLQDFNAIAQSGNKGTFYDLKHGKPKLQEGTVDYIFSTEQTKSGAIDLPSHETKPILSDHRAVVAEVNMSE